MDHRTALLVLLRQRLTTLFEAMPAAQAGDVRSVHQARVATRRLRAALPVVGAAVNVRSLGRVGRQVRRMTRVLGPVRELDVSLAHLDELGTKSIVSSRALARVRQAMARERLDRRQDMLAEITPSNLEKLRQRLAHMETQHETSYTGAALDEAATRIRRRADRLTAAIDRAGGLYLPDRLHAVRVAAKKLRYALEIERELTRSRVTARILQLKRLQDLLGRMHDFEILIDRTRQLQAEVAGSDRRFAVELDRLIRTLEEECRQQHAIYMRRRLSILKLCDLLRAGDQRRPSAVA